MVPEPSGGDRRSGRNEAQAQDVPDVTLEELRERLIAEHRENFAPRTNRDFYLR